MEALNFILPLWSLFTFLPAHSMTLKQFLIDVLEFKEFNSTLILFDIVSFFLYLQYISVEATMGKRSVYRSYRAPPPAAGEFDFPLADVLLSNFLQ
jgi:hypothetical protein